MAQIEPIFVKSPVGKMMFPTQHSAPTQHKRADKALFVGEQLCSPAHLFEESVAFKAGQTKRPLADFIPVKSPGRANDLMFFVKPTQELIAAYKSLAGQEALIDSLVIDDEHPEYSRVSIGENGECAGYTIGLLHRDFVDSMIRLSVVN